MCYVTDAIDARGELKWGLDLVWFVWGSSADNNSERERGATGVDCEREHVCDRLVSEKTCQREKATRRGASAPVNLYAT